MSQALAKALKAPAHWPRSALLGACLASAPAALAAQTLTMEAVTPEAQEGQGFGIDLLLKLDAPAEYPFMAQVQLAGVDAQGGVDFTPPVIPVTFGKNDVRKRANVTIIDDPDDELSRETFIASVDSVTSLEPGTAPSIINGAAAIPLTIIDDDNAFSVTAAPGPEGGAVVLTVRQEYDSETEEVISASPAQGSATPGADFEPWANYGHIPPGTLETTISIGLREDTITEGDETFPIELTHMGIGTARFSPARATGKIVDTTERGTAFRVVPGTFTIEIIYDGKVLASRQEQFAGYQVKLIHHRGGSRLTMVQPDRMNLEFQRVCTEDTDFEAIARNIDGASPADIGAGNRTGWRGSHSQGTYAQVWTMFEQPDGSYAGFTQLSEDTGAKARGWGRWSLIPVDDPVADVERLPAEPPRAQLPPEAVTDSVARQVARDLGMSPEAVAPYLSTSLGPDMTRGDGNSARAVEVEIWLDAQGRPLRAGRAAPDPCDPGYGAARPAVKRLRYRLHAFEGTITAQAAVQDVETGVLEKAYMEDLGEASNDLDTAAQRAHDGLAPDVSAPE